MVICLHCFEAYGRAGHCGGESMVEETVDLIVTRKQRGNREGMRGNIMLKGIPPQDLLPPARFPLLMFSPLPNSATSWRPNLQCDMHLWGTF
jgi:hypothetical protein